MTNELHVSPTHRFNPTEAAAALGVSRKTIYNAMTAGEIRYTTAKVTGRRYITGQALIRYYNTH